MQYHKFIVKDTVIEFYNNWLGEETVTVNGQIVSKESSMFGRNHHFTILEEGKHARYVLTTKVTDMMQVALDLRRNGKFLYEDVIVRYGSKSKKPKNKSKKLGLNKLNEYELEEAVSLFKKALDVDPKDPEIWFHLACAYSILENVEEGYHCLKKSVENKLDNTDMILTHEMLAFLRIQDTFETFLDSNFKDYSF